MRYRVRRSEVKMKNDGLGSSGNGRNTYVLRSVLRLDYYVVYESRRHHRLEEEGIAAKT